MIYDYIREKYPILWGHIEKNEKGDRFQNALGDFIREIKPDIVVETGVELGLSSDRILRALEDNKKGALFSCDADFPFSRSPTPEIMPVYVPCPRWHTWPKESVYALPEIFMETGPWDVFLHDSDHEVGCQTFEYELAWHCLKPGGYLLSDDYTWGSPEHHALRRFTNRHGADPERVTIGSCIVVRKPLEAVAPPEPGYGRRCWLHDRVKDALDLADNAAIAYGERGYP